MGEQFKHEGHEESTKKSFFMFFFENLSELCV